MIPRNCRDSLTDGKMQVAVVARRRHPIGNRSGVARGAGVAEIGAHRPLRRGPFGRRTRQIVARGRRKSGRTAMAMANTRRSSNPQSVRATGAGGRGRGRSIRAMWREATRQR